MKSIQIVGFTPLGVILAERLTYSQSNISKNDSNVYLIEYASSLSNDTHWQSLSLFCLINLLKQCRMLLSDSSKKFGINIENIKMNEQRVYSYIKLATQRVQKYYLTLLKQRQIKFELFDDQIESNERMKESSMNKHVFCDENETESIYLCNHSSKSFERLLNNDDFELIYKKPWQSYFSPSKRNTISLDNENYITYGGHASYPGFDQSLRLNAVHAIFQYLLSYPSLKLIGPDIFAFEFAHLLSSLGHNQIYLYRMNPYELSLLPITETNANLVTFFQVFSKFIHEPLIQTTSNGNHRPTLHIIEHFHQFKLNLNAEGQLEYEKLIEPIMPISRTPEETKKHKRTYLETFRQRTQESFTQLSTPTIDTTIDVKEEPLDHFPPSSTFFILADVNTSSDLKTHLKRIPSLPKAIRTFNSTPGALIQNIYTTLRTIVNDEKIPQLTNIFLSVDHELCVIKNQTRIGNNEFGMDEIIESPQHDLQRPVENLHDLYKIIQRPMDQTGQLMFYESQLFQNDALDLQSLLLLFNPEQEIPKNELIFLFYNKYDWHNQLVLPNRLTVKNNNQRNSLL